MTLDDLKRIFQKARLGTRDWNGTGWVGEWGGDDAGIRAVVEALRDELVGKSHDGGLEDAMNEILASDGVGEKAAGGPAREGGPGGLEQPDPARTPAADTIPCPHCKGDGCTPQLDRRGNVYPEPCQLCDSTGRIPAPAAAPVCEWRIKEYCWETSCGRNPINTPPAGYPNCSCGKPIKFKSEAAR